MGAPLYHVADARAAARTILGSSTDARDEPAAPDPELLRWMAAVCPHHRGLHYPPNVLDGLRIVLRPTLRVRYLAETPFAGRVSRGTNREGFHESGGSDDAVSTRRQLLGGSGCG